MKYAALKAALLQKEQLNALAAVRLKLSRVHRLDYDPPARSRLISDHGCVLGWRCARCAPKCTACGAPQAWRRDLDMHGRCGACHLNATFDVIFQRRIGQ